MTPNLDSFVSVPLPTALVVELLKRSPGGISELITTVVWDFLERTEDVSTKPPQSGGVWWEALFLPDGTELRTRYFGQFKLAKVDGESIVMDGTVYPSPAQLTNAMRGGTSNSAWRELQIKRPNDKTWMAAQTLRRG